MSGTQKLFSLAPLCKIVFLNAGRVYGPKLAAVGLTSWYALSLTPGKGFKIPNAIKPVEVDDVNDYKIRVMVWPSDAETGAVGHAAIQVGTEASPDQYHLSYWPKNVLQAGLSVLAGGILNAGECYTLKSDLEAEGRAPEVYELSASPEQVEKAIAVIQELKSMNKSGQLTYSMVFHNSKGAELQQYLRGHFPLISAALGMPKDQGTLNCVDAVKTVLTESGIEVPGEFSHEIMSAVTPCGFQRAFSKAADHPECKTVLQGIFKTTPKDPDSDHPTIGK